MILGTAHCGYRIATATMPLLTSQPDYILSRGRAIMNQTITHDLAGVCPAHPSYLQIRRRINRLINRYLSISILSGHVADLPSQFSRPHQRPWEPIDWKAISSEQIIGVDPAIFLMVVASASEIEAPIRGYSQESWNYMQSLHPQMAHFMGGEHYPDGSLKQAGVWEKEERQHAPAFSKIYQQLTGTKLQLKTNSVLGYQPTGNPLADMYDHTICRISTEWGAITTYLWLMAHSTGALQQAIAQPLQDEVNHLAKFWGFSRWAFSVPYWQQCNDVSTYLFGLLRHQRSERTYGRDIAQKTVTLGELIHGVEIAFILTRIMVRIRSWQPELSDSFLHHLLGEKLAMMA
jgi:hypothetical protein